MEIKADANLHPYPGLEAAVASELDAAGMTESTVITSFYIENLVRFRAVARPRNLIWLVKNLVFAHIGGIEQALNIAKANGIEEIALHQSMVSPEAATAAAAADIRLGAFAVNDQAAIRRMLDLGITVFTSDHPDLALKMRDQIRGR